MGNWVIYLCETEEEVISGEWELNKLCDLKTFLALSKPFVPSPSTTINFRATREDVEAARNKYRPIPIKEWAQETETHS
jgi:hypothetical protein